MFCRKTSKEEKPGKLRVTTYLHLVQEWELLNTVNQMWTTRIKHINSSPREKAHGYRHSESDGYRILKRKPGKGVMKSVSHLGTVFNIKNSYSHAMQDFKSVNERIRLLPIKTMNKTHTLVSVHASINTTTTERRTGRKQITFWICYITS